MKAILFPYDTKNLIFADYNKLLNVDVKYYVYLGDMDLGKFGAESNNLVERDKLQNRITDEMLNEVDALCIVDSLSEINETELLAVITDVAKKRKKIILASHTYLKYKEKIKRICDENHVELIMYYNLNFNNDQILNGTKMEIEAPVITIMGMLPMTQKFELQLYLRRKFIDKGYKVSQIGTRPVSELFGFHALPEYFFTNKYTDVEKIIAFNNFVKNIEKEEKPDVIIIGIPDVVIPFSKKHNFSFGIYAYEILSAVQPDFAFMNLSAGEYNQDFFNEIRQMCLYKFNIDIDAYFISKYGLISSSLWANDLAFAMVDETKIPDDVENVFNHLDLEANRIYDLVESKLTRYGRFIQY